MGCCCNKINNRNNTNKNDISLTAKNEDDLNYVIKTYTTFDNGENLNEQNKENNFSLLGDNEVNECPICLKNIFNDDERFGDKEKKTSWCHFGCNHQFHIDCISRWFERKLSCPICNQYPFSS